MGLNSGSKIYSRGSRKRYPVSDELSCARRMLVSIGVGDDHFVSLTSALPYHCLPFRATPQLINVNSVHALVLSIGVIIMQAYSGETAV